MYILVLALFSILFVTMYLDHHIHDEDAEADHLYGLREATWWLPGLRPEARV